MHFALNAPSVVDICWYFRKVWFKDWNLQDGRASILVGDHSLCSLCVWMFIYCWFLNVYFQFSFLELQRTDAFVGIARHVERSTKWLLCWSCWRWQYVLFTWHVAILLAIWCSIIKNWKHTASRSIWTVFFFSMWLDKKQSRKFSWLNSGIQELTLCSLSVLNIA